MPWTVTDYRNQYGAAEALSQEVQNFRNEAGIPAMNELRNAGHHFLKALADDGSLQSQDELNSAVNHARRACYEATEAGIVMAVVVVKKFQDDYSTVEISDLVTDYASRCRRCTQGLQMIEAGRQAGFDRDADHRDRIDVFREIRPFADDLTIARPEANKRVTQKRRDTRRFIIQCILTVGVGAAAIIAAFQIG